ncbi:hypothetical protein SPSIL_009630 [Sporomusa silvacetica DSM 10669]|uniref:SLH domain-containing protein n=1 Tax=Sporomusa silvacetica DSM 10669 TaxID=1123289 RepID=A0ABZ3IGP9_9FIRM|nr:S-layer homology domain-containing protein [Sporomusa silvacetica]OZC13077.1 outer membrane protein alpha precursor [Sporomusa silvacetica DSM 10669]
MKRNLAATLALIFGLGIGSTAFAATSPFEDIPKNHWAYGAVKQLAQAGIVDGYGNGTFRGDSTLTRYEMATLIANAMTKTDKATAEQKAIIDKLASEYASELEGINGRVTKLESKVSNVKVGGEVRYRYEWTDNKDGSPDTYTRVRINLFAPLTDKLIFSGRIEGENRIGTKSDINIAHAFIAGKALGFDTFVLGRMPLALGQGLLSGIGAAGNCTTGADGIVLGAGNQLKVTVAAGKAGSDEGTSLNLKAANLSYDLNKSTNLSASYLGDKESSKYKAYAAGFNYKGIKNIKVTTEYGKNESDWAKSLNNSDGATAWYITTKYRGADPEKDNSDGFWVGYRNADAGFDPLTLGNAEGSGLQKTFDPTNPTAALAMSNAKGFEFGYERTVFKNAIFSLQYNDLEKKDDKTSADSLLAALTYSF